MGHGNWSRDSFAAYNRAKGRTMDASGKVTGKEVEQQMFGVRDLDPLLDPKNVTRECCDTPEHPNTIPVILALDVTGSMGQAAVEVARQLNVIMTKLYNEVDDIEFLIMGIGDLECDRVPIQISQFESDIRIADQLDRIYFEFGGGGNTYESYTAAWYMAARHTRLDCWKRGKKGILITMGDETLNPYLPVKGMRSGLAMVTGDALQADIETADLIKEVREKYDVFHLNVNHRIYTMNGIESSFRKYLDKRHFRDVTLENISDQIISIIKESACGKTEEKKGLISW